MTKLTVSIRESSGVEKSVTLELGDNPLSAEALAELVAHFLVALRYGDALVLNCDDMVSQPTPNNK